MSNNVKYIARNSITKKWFAAGRNFSVGLEDASSLTGPQAAVVNATFENVEVVKTRSEEKQ